LFREGLWSGYSAGWRFPVALVCSNVGDRNRSYFNPCNLRKEITTMCCGQKRAELRNSQAQRTARSVLQHTFSNSPAQTVRTQPSVPPPTPRTGQYEPARPQTGNVPPQAPAPVSMPESSVSVRYLETSPIQVRGLVSGMSYAFSGSQPVQQVDPRDASSLLNTRFFRRAS
jgi:hypothetical protein